LPVPEKSDAYTPRDAPLGGVESRDLFPARPNFAFFLVHHPENWETGIIDGKAWWLPELQRQTLEPGVNNVRTLQRGEPAENAYDHAHLRMKREKITPIPQRLDVEIVNADGSTTVIDRYRQVIDCKDPKSGREGLLHIDRWERPNTPRPGKRTKFKRDRDGYNRWRLALVSMGFIAPPHDDIADEKIARADYHAGRHAEKMALPEDHRERLAAAGEAKLAELEAAAVPDVGSKPDDASDAPDAKPRGKAKRKPRTRKKPAAKKGGAK